MIERNYTTQNNSNKNFNKELLISEIDLLTYNLSHSNKSLNYIDFLQIVTLVKKEYRTKLGYVPEKIKQELDRLEKYVSPRAVKEKAIFSKLSGSLFGTLGLAGIIYAILEFLIGAVIVTSSVGGFLGFGAVTVTSIMWGGPIGLLFGVVFFFFGLYLILKRENIGDRVLIAIDSIKTFIKEYSI